MRKMLVASTLSRASFAHSSRVLFFIPSLIPQWPHNTGPLMTYMAACDTSTCDKFNGSTAKWFKIDQIGKKSDGSTWYQQDISA